MVVVENLQKANLVRSCKKLNGKIFGRLLIVGVGAYDSGGHQTLFCACSCGESPVRAYRKTYVTSGKALSCGCIPPKRKPNINPQTILKVIDKNSGHCGRTIYKFIDDKGNRYIWLGKVSWSLDIGETAVFSGYHKKRIGLRYFKLRNLIPDKKQKE